MPATLPWKEIESLDEFQVLPPERKAKAFSRWRDEALQEHLTADDADATDITTFLAKSEAKESGYLGKPIADPLKDYQSRMAGSRQSQGESFKLWDAFTTAQGRLQDARLNAGLATGTSEYGDNTSPAADEAQQQVAAAALEVERARSALPEPEKLQAAAEAREGKRDAAMFGSDLYVNPSLLLDKDAYKSAVLKSEATPAAKARAIARFAEDRNAYAQKAVDTFQSAPDIPLQDSFAKWSERQEGERKAPEVRVLDYMREMQGRNWFRKLGNQIATNLLVGGADIATQGLSLGAALTGDEAAAQKAGEISKGAQVMGAPMELEGGGDDVMLRGTGQAARMLPMLAEQILLGKGAGKLGGMFSKAVGDAATVAVGFGSAGAQTGGLLFADTYGQLREQGASHEDALSKSRQGAILAGAITTVLTSLGGKTGAEALLRDGAGKRLVQSRLKDALKEGFKGAGFELLEETPDELASQIITDGITHPEKPVSETVGTFITNFPELAVSIGLIGGGAGTAQSVMETTTATPEEIEAAQAAQAQTVESGEIPVPPAVRRGARGSVELPGVGTVEFDSSLTADAVLGMSEAELNDAISVGSASIKPAEPIAPLAGIVGDATPEAIATEIASNATVHAAAGAVEVGALETAAALADMEEAAPPAVESPPINLPPTDSTPIVESPVAPIPLSPAMAAGTPYASFARPPLDETPAAQAPPAPAIEPLPEVQAGTQAEEVGAAQARINDALSRQGEEINTVNEGGKTVAALSLKRHADGALEITSVGSLRPGVGSELVQKAIATAKAEGLALFTIPTFDAEPFWAKMGFAEPTDGTQRWQYSPISKVEALPPVGQNEGEGTQGIQTEPAEGSIPAVAAVESAPSVAESSVSETATPDTRPAEPVNETPEPIQVTIHELLDGEIVETQEAPTKELLVQYRKFAAALRAVSKCLQS